MREWGNCFLNWQDGVCTVKMSGYFQNVETHLFSFFISCRDIYLFSFLFCSFLYTFLTFILTCKSLSSLSVCPYLSFFVNIFFFCFLSLSFVLSISYFFLSLALHTILHLIQPKLCLTLEYKDFIPELLSRV